MHRKQNTDLIPADTELEKTLRSLRKIKKAGNSIMADERQEQTDEHREAVRRPPITDTMEDFWRPIIQDEYSAIRQPAVEANNFELKPALITMVQQHQFTGHPTEDPNEHLGRFLRMANTVKLNGVRPEVIKLHLFPFSLRDTAATWYESLPYGSVDTWEELVEAYLCRFFPPSLTSERRREIIVFQQGEDESLYVAWERFKRLLKRCPMHGIDLKTQIDIVYHALNDISKGIIDASCCGAFKRKSAEEARDLIEDLAKCNMKTPSEFSRGTSRGKGILELNKMSAMEAKLDAIMHRMDKQEKKTYTAHEIGAVERELLKDILSKKRKIEREGIVNLTATCSALMKKELPEKMKDPGSFTIPCMIEGVAIQKALCDSGASINLMPLSVAKQLSLGELIPTTITLQMADRSMVKPEGVLEDVLVTVGKFVFPVDFIVLEMETDSQVPLLLGRPFLATGAALIDMQKGVLTLRVGEEAAAINLIEGMQNIDIDREMSNIVDDVYTHNYDVQDDCNDQIFINEKEINFQYIEDEYSEFPFDSFHSIETVMSMEQGKEEQEGNNEKKEIQQETSEEGLVLKELPSHLKYIYLEPPQRKPVIISARLSDEEEHKLLQILKKHKESIAWSIEELKGISPSICMHKILLEETSRPTVEHQRRLNPVIKEVVKKEVLKLLNVGFIYAISDSPWVSPVHVVPKKGGFTVIRNEKNELIPTRTVTGWRVCIDYRKLNTATRKDHFPLPFIDQMLDRLAGHPHFCFLDGYSGYNQIAIAPEDQEKTTFTCPYGTFAFRRMPFGLCNAPATFQRCMMSIFSDLVEEVMEIFMDDFTVYGSSFDQCLQNLETVLQRCRDKQLALNWEKCHFMVTEGIVLGHKISATGLEVDQSKVSIIKTLAPPTTVKGVRSFLGHAGFYRRFIKDFSKIARPLCRLLEKDSRFNFDDSCRVAFEEIKSKLIQAPVMAAPDWDQGFEIMCDASDFAMGAALGQRKEKIFRIIYYASITFNEAQENYSTTEKEMLAIVFACEKFRQYILGSHVVVHTDHAAIKYLMSKKEAKPRLIRWVLLLQEFDLEIKDKRGCDNVIADHLSRAERSTGEEEEVELKENFPDEQLFTVSCQLPDSVPQ